jgi:hypothetical protein
MSVVLLGSTSGSVTLQEPAVAGSTVIDLPATSGTMAVLPTATGVLTQAAGGTGTTTGYYGFKNRIINGAMVIDQRNAGASVTPTTSAYTLDRWQATVGQSSKLSFQQNAPSLGSVTPPSGFTNYLGVTSLSAYPVLTGDYFALRQAVEGFNISDLNWGTANAKTITLSFQVYSSLTGTFGGSLVNSANNRSYPFTYTVSSANTWTTVSVTIAGDTSGTWLTTNGIGINVYFGLGMGSTFSGTAGSWSGNYYLSATGATSVVGTNGATFYITGVQLEKGSTATSFDYRPYGTELQLCQRYTYVPSAVYQAATASGLQYNASSGFFSLQFPVFMRTAPTLNSITASNWVVLYQGAGAIPTAITLNASASSGASLFTSQTISAGNPLILWPGNTSAQMIFSAEL